MTLAEARMRIGERVVYRPESDFPEPGVITSVNERYVFVRYGDELHSKATGADDLVTADQAIEMWGFKVEEETCTTSTGVTIATN